MKFVIILLFAFNYMEAQYNSPSKKKEDAWLKIGIGAYMHALSGIFLTNDLRGPNTKQAFVYMNVATIQIDLIGIIQLRKLKKKK